MSSNDLNDRELNGRGRAPLVSCVEDRKAASKQKLDDLRNHHSQCEVNYHQCLALIPGCRDGESQWDFSLDTAHKTEVSMTLLESAPYTTTIELYQAFRDAAYLEPPRLKVRLYHDVEMAEVIAWNRHRHWQPVYEYPNKSMYQPDEKLVLNRFLGEMLNHCRKLGIASGSACESIRINKN